MTKLKNQLTSQVSIVTIPEKPIDIYSIPTDLIRAKMIDVIKGSQPVVTQFPDLFLIVDTNNQFAVNILRQNNRIIVADNRVTPYDGRDLSNFYRLVSEINEIVVRVPNKIIGYGLNIMTIFDIETESGDGGDEIKKRFVNEKNLNETFDHIISAGVKFVHVEGGVRYDLTLDPRFGPNLEKTNQINVNLNAHNVKSLPDLSSLQTSCNAIYSSLGQNIVKIFA